MDVRCSVKLENLKLLGDGCEMLGETWNLKLLGDGCVMLGET
jgi:hypothetical protein